MKIRRMEENDIEAVKDVYAEAFERNRSSLKYYPGFDTYVGFCIDQGYAFVAEDEDKAVGIIFGYIKPDAFRGRAAYIEVLAVIPEYQNRGIGKSLISKIEIPV